MTDAIRAMDNADEIIERLAKELEAEAYGEARFMETTGIPLRLGCHLAIAALHRASVKLQGRIDRKEA